jgi:sulfotransferase
MNADSGLVGSAWSALREAWFGADADRLVLLEYDRLAKQPEQSLDRLYRVLGEPPFRHDFDNVVYDEPDYDFLLGMPGMHRVDREVRFRRRDPCIPPDLHEKYSDWRFWAKPGLNPRGILVV